MRDAFALLTIIPTGQYRSPSRGTVLAFPLVGLVIGAAQWLVALGSVRAWGFTVAGCLAVVTDVMLTGGMHLDAVADMGDAFGSRKKGEPGLEVARDSRIGAFGAIATVIAIVLSVALVQRLLAEGRATDLIVAAIVLRTSMVVVLVFARGEGSSAADLARATGWMQTLGGLGVGAGLCCAIGGLIGFAALALSMGVAASFGLLCRNRFGVLSGDATGAAGVLGYLAALLVVAARAA